MRNVEMVSQYGAIATPHSSATNVGMEVLSAGGNAIDAAIAAAAVLCVVYPNNVALGSDLVALLHEPSGDMKVVNATGPAPLELSLDELQKRHGDTLPQYGVDTINVPGAIRGWESLLQLGGTRSWGELLTPAMQYARDGVNMPSSVANGIIRLQNELWNDPGCRSVFFEGDVPIPVGQPFYQSALATTFERLIEAGADDFYNGSLADQWLPGLQRLGSKISAEDLKGFKPEIEAPLVKEAAGFSFISSGPNTQGFSLLRAMSAALHGQSKAEGTLNHVDLANAFIDSNAVRDQYLSDPKYGGMQGQELLETPVPLVVDSSYKGRPMGDTVGISVASADGYAVSIIQSVYFQFGAAILEPETGILFQNRGTSFSLNAGSANSFEPGKRPSHTLMPAMIREDGRLRYVLSTMGGQGQPQIHAQLFAYGLAGNTPQDSVSLPRWLVGRQTPDDSADTLTIEENSDLALVESFKVAGFEVKTVPVQSDIVGHANLIEISDTGVMHAASDPRSDGSAVAI